MPSIDKVEDIQPYLFAGYQQLVVSGCHPMEQTRNHDHRFTPEAESRAVKVN
jgi:hypothetical protein